MFPFLLKVLVKVTELTHGVFSAEAAISSVLRLTKPTPVHYKG